MVEPNPCVVCGACCATFRVSFYWSEADDATPGGVPVELTKKLNDFRLMMIGAEGSHPRCIALSGAIGVDAHCSIYERRSSTCREFLASYENGEPDERCDQARKVWGLEPLTLASWAPEDLPHVA